MKSILFVSIAFPPKFDSEGLQVAKYFKYFRKECEGKLIIDVVTSPINTLNMPVDDSLKDVDNGFRQKIVIRIFENKYINYLFRHFAPLLVHNPDSKHSFFRQWRSVVKQLKSTPVIIYSRSNPTSSAIMAMKLKDYYQVPWIMHLSDPWADSPVAGFTGKIKARNEYYEQLCFSKADKICLTSDKTIDFYSEKYPQYSDKFLLYPNVYDPQDIKPIEHKPENRKLKIVYTGGIAGNRSPQPFLHAISILPAIVRNKMEVIFAGIADRQNISLFEKYKDPSITYLGSLATYQEALSLQQQADVLLLIDFPIKEKKLRMYFLSKLLDYMITGNYIIGISGEGSVVWDIINNKMGKCFEENDSEGIKGHLIYLVNQFENGVKLADSYRISSDFDASCNAKKLFFLVESLIN